MSAETVDAVAAHARAAFSDTVATLSDYLSYPAISCEAEHASDVVRLAERIAEDLTALGCEPVRVLSLDGALPCVAADLCRVPGAPTLLIYGHLDLQPVAGEPWNTDPHVATVIGDRLFARGAADDIGGWVSHLAAIKSWKAIVGELPCNIKLVIEGEEEIGSPNLERYMDAFPEVFEADAMVLTDCENPSTEIPGLTVSLRGLLEFDLTVEAIGSDVHSGLWGNMVPDVSVALMKLIARVTDDDGRLDMLRVDVPEDWRADAYNVPLDTEVVRSAANLVDGVDPLPERGRPPAEWVWRQPALTVLSTTLPGPDRRKNALRTKATATLSVRVAPGQTHEVVHKALAEALLRDPPGGVKVSLDMHEGGADSWLYTPSGPAFPAADRAYQKAWGRPMLQVGVGGSIPFVALFGRRFSSLPLILNGVMDPETGAHGPNESLHLGVFEKAIVANVYLYDELARALAKDSTA